MMAWEVKKLADIKSITFMRGNGLNKSVLDDTGTHKCILYGDLYTKYTHPIIREVINKTNSEGKVKSKKGDVLIPGTTTADAFGIAIARSINEDGILLGGDINILRTNNEELLSDFLSYYINGPAKWELASYATGTNIMHLSNKKIQNIEVPIPPLPIQKKIVEVLDSAFEKIAKAKENSEANLKNVKEVFESYLQKVFENKGEDWEETTIGDVCEVIAGQSPEGKYYNKNEKGLPFYQGKKEFTDKFIGEPTTWTTKTTKKSIKNDVLMSVRAPVGPVNFATQDICIGRGLAAIRTSEKMNYNLLFDFLLSIQDKLVGNNGAVFNSINKTQIENISITIPKSLEEQKAIVSKLDNLSEQTKQLESIYTQKLSSLKELKQSILQKAFKGELTEVET